MITSFFGVFAKYFLLFAIFFDSAVAWFVLSRGWKRPVNQAYFFMIFCFTLWQISNFMATYFVFASDKFYLYLFFLRGAFVAAALIMVTMFYFINIFPNGKHNLKLLKNLLTLGFMFAFISATSVVVRYINSIQSGISAKISFKFGWFYPFYVVFITTFLILSLLVIIRKLRHEREVKAKLQYQYLFIAFLIPVVLGGTTNLFLPFFNYLFNNRMGIYLSESTLGVSSTVFLSGIIAYAILHHRLMDIKTVIRRNSLAAAAHLISIGTIIFIVWLINKGFGQLLNTLQLLIVLFITGSVLILTRPLYRLVNKIIKREYLHLYPYNDIEKIILERTANPQDFSHCAAAHFLRRLPVNPFYVLIYDVKEVCFRVMFPDYTNTSRVYGCNERWLNFFRQNKEIYFVEKNEPAHNKDVNEIAAKLHTQCFIPLIPYNQLLGVVVVGKRVDLKPLTKKDKSFMEEFQKSIGLTLVDVLQLHHIVLAHLDDPEAIERVKPMISKLKR